MKNVTSHVEPEHQSGGSRSRHALHEGRFRLALGERYHRLILHGSIAAGYDHRVSAFPSKL